MAAEYKLVVEQGEDYTKAFRVLDGTNQPFNWSDWTISADIKETVTSSPVVAAFNVNADADGYIWLSLSHEVTKDLTLKCYYYDVLAVRNSDDFHQYLIGGKIVVNRSVTLDSNPPASYHASYWTPAYFGGVV